jgi:hypothetical protein
MIIDKKIVYARKKEEFEPLIPTIPEGLNPVVFIEDTREVWTCGTYFSIGYPSIEVSEVSGSVKVQIGNSFFLLTPTGDSISLRKGDGNRIIISSNALNRVDTEPPLKWDASNRKLLHMESGVASGSYGQSTNLGNASVFVVPNFIVDATGHITFAENHNIEIRDYVEQVAPSNQMAERNILLSYNEANNNMDTSQVRKANGLTFNDATQRITVAGGMVSDGAVTVNHGDVSVLDGYIIGKLKGDVEGQATPKIHLSLKPEYGGASTKLYGHVKLQDILSRKPDPSSDNENINDTNVVAAIAASPLMVWNAIETAKSYADSILGSNNAMLFKGALEAGISSPGTYTPMADVGNTYVVTFGNGAYRDSVGYINGVSVEVGDLLICKEATAASDGTNWEEVSKKWTYVQTNTTGVVSGPSSATIGQLAVFDSITGKLIKGLPNGSVGQMLVINESGIPTWANKPDRLNHALSFQVKGVEFTSFDGYEAKKVNFIAGDNMFITPDNQGNLTLAADPGNDTVNTAGATDLINTKLFLIGAESQTESPQTYSNRYVYVGADNCLYSDGKKVSTTDHTHPIYVTLDTEQTINGSKTFTTPIISTVASGTAPLVVASNTLVSNLNADLLDGLHAKSFIFYKEEDFDPATYDGYYMGMTTKSGINTNWWHIISMNWGGSNMGIVGNKTWVTQLALPTKGIRGLKYRTGNNSTSYGSWVDILDTTNYAGTLDGRYLKKTGDTMTGTLTSASTSSSIVFKGLENCDITNIYKDNGVIRNDDGGFTSIRNGLRFNWYDTYWYIGNLRGGSTESAGFGVVDHNNKLVLRVTPNDVRAPRFMSTVATGLSPLIVSSNTLVNNLNADLLDGLHENSFLRHRDTYGIDGYNTLWAQIGIRQYNDAKPDGMANPIYDYGAVISLPGANTRLDIWYNHTSSASDSTTNGIQYRSGFNDDKKPWRMLLDSVNYASYSDGRYVKKAGDTMTGTLGMGANTIYWKENGFGDKFGLTPYFSGTNDNDYLAFMSSVGEAGTDPAMSAKMVLTGLGNVGIGTTTPTQKLHVIGGGLFTALLTTTGITNNGTLTQNGDIIINQASTTGTRQVRFQGGDNDYGRVAYGGTASNAGWMEIASCDDGNEPIYARQYTGVFTTVKRTATLLDANGNTVFPGTVTAPTFTGALNGTAEWSKRLATNSQLTFGLNGLTYFNANLGAGTAANQNVGPTAQWWHILRMNHGNGSGYFADIAVPLNTSDGIYWRRIQGGTNYGWYRVLDTNNYAGIIDGRYVNVTGDTMTGALHLANGTRNKAGDDCGFGDCNIGGCLGLQGLNGATGLAFIQQGASWSGGNNYRFTWNGSNMTSSSTAQWNNLNADLLDGYHQAAFSMGWTTSTKYRVDRWGGGTDKNWKKIVTYVCTGGGQYQSCKVKGTIYYITGNHNQGHVIDIPFEAIMYAYGGTANSMLNQSTLYLPPYCTWDMIRIVRYNNNSWEVQVRQPSDWTNISLEYTVTNNGGSVSAGQFINTSYSSTVANNYNTNVSRPTSSRVSSADKVNSTLSFSAGGFSTKSFNGSSNQTVNIPTHTSHLTNNSGFITSSASISGNAGSATKLQTARTINGTSFNGTANITTSYWGTARNFTIGNTTRSVNGSGNVSWSFADIGCAPASHSHNYINSRGNLNPQTGRTQNLGNVYSYNTISGTSNGAPTTYTSVIGFGRSTRGTVEIAGGWTAGMGLWYRALRDTTDNWYGWVKVWDTKNFDPNSKANSNHNHDGSYITKGGSNNNVVLGAGGYRALSDFTLNSNWAASKDVSGYVKFPNGFIIQWGEAYVGANSTGYKSFPIAFPTACISVQVTHKTTATNWDKVCVAGNYTRTSCTIANGETVNSMINWMALGY